MAFLRSSSSSPALATSSPRFTWDGIKTILRNLSSETTTLDSLRIGSKQTGDAFKLKHVVFTHPHTNPAFRLPGSRMQTPSTQTAG